MGGAEPPGGVPAQGHPSREHLRNKSITYNWHDPETSFLEAVLSRGDRRLADVLETAWRKGAKFDAWSEFFSLDTWLDALAAHGLDPAFYANRVREKDEVFPWAAVSDGVKESYLWRERERGLRRHHHPRLPGEMFRLRGQPPV